MHTSTYTSRPRGTFPLGKVLYVSGSPHAQEEQDGFRGDGMHSLAMEALEEGFRPRQWRWGHTADNVRKHC